MKILRDGRLWKIARITGPKHNFLGLILAEQSIGEPEVQRLGDLHASAHLDQAEVVEQVLLGLADANAAAETQLYLHLLQFLPTDSSPATTYRLLARTIAEEAHREISGESN